MSKAALTYEAAPAAYNQQQKAVTAIGPQDWQVITKGTAAGSTTNTTGYAIGAVTIGLAAAGTGTFQTGDSIQFAGDANTYTVVVGESNVADGGSITITPGLVVAQAAAATKAITLTASAPSGVLGATGGATADWLDSLTVVVSTAATAQVTVSDGANLPIVVFPASPGGGIGTYRVEGLGASKSGPWKVACGVGATVIARGRFS